MAMVVKNNMSAVSTLNTLNKNSSALQKSLSKVSSGMKINSAQDDASGYAISERMRVQIRSLDQANQNTQNGSSLMKTAEGAVSSTVEILKSLKEKAINAANDTNKDSDRTTIQKEIDQFIDQIDDNALTTFNGKYLVDGSKSFQGVAVATSFTNQSLGKDVEGTTALTALTNRNDESLEIESTDYVTASYVQNGKTETVKFKVGDNSLDDIFKTLDSKGADKGIFSGGMTLDKAKETFANFMSDTKTFTTTAEREAELKAAADYAAAVKTAVNNGLAAGNTTAQIKTAVEGINYTGQSKDVRDAVVKLASTTTDGTKATSGKDDALSAMVAEAKDTLASSVKSYLLTQSSKAFGGTQETSTASGTATFASSNTDIAQAEYVAIKNDGSNTTETGKMKLTADNTDGGITNFANAIADTIVKGVSGYADGTAGTGSDAAAWAATALTGAKGNGNAIDIGAKDSTSKADAENLALTQYAEKIGTQLAGSLSSAGISGGDIVKGKTNVIGTDAAGDTVYTADGTNGLTVTAGTTGLQGQISGITISISDSQGNVKKAANAALDGFSTSIYAKNASNNNELSFQVGAAANQAIAVGLEDMRSEALGLKGSDGSKVSVATQDKANAAVAVFDNAIAKALDQQTTIGSIEARLAYTSENLTVSSENTQAAESTIRDADMAKEMTNYTKNNVLLQAAQSMLAQANQSSSAVLSLLQ